MQEELQQKKGNKLFQLFLNINFFLWALNWCCSQDEPLAEILGYLFTWCSSDLGQPVATTSVLSIRRRQRLRHKSSDKLKVSADEGARDDNSHVAPAKLAQGDNEDIWSPQAHEVDQNFESMAIFPAQGPNRFIDPACCLQLGLIILIILACYVHSKSICIQTVQWTLKAYIHTEICKRGCSASMEDIVISFK
jgi:hypothetical protein